MARILTNMMKKMRLNRMKSNLEKQINNKNNIRMKRYKKMIVVRLKAKKIKWK